jgi:hypothetical protein
MFSGTIAGPMVSGTIAGSMFSGTIAGSMFSGTIAGSMRLQLGDDLIVRLHDHRILRGLRLHDSRILRGLRLHDHAFGVNMGRGLPARGCYVRVGVGSAVSSRLLLSG